MLNPTVIWGQRKEFIFLRVALLSCEKPDFTVNEDRMQFKVIGIGRSGRQEYGFELAFYDSLVTENMRVVLSDKEVQFKILKKEAVMWPKLQLQQEKPHWLKLDFDLMQESSDEEEAGNEKFSALDKEMMQKTTDELQQKIKEAENELIKFRKVKKLVTTGYLLVYNCIQWSGFFLIFVNTILLVLKGNDSVKNVYEVTGKMMKFCVFISLLEIVHVYLKLVKASILPTAAQVFGRSLILFGVIVPNAVVQSNRAVAMLFACWSAIEIFRYPFYILGLLGREIYVLTWLRYTAWILLYPAGFAIEGSIIYNSIPYFAKTKLWSLQLPNVLNFAFDFSIFLWIYLVVMLSGSSYLLMHMWRQRDRKLVSKPNKEGMSRNKTKSE